MAAPSSIWAMRSTRPPRRWPRKRQRRLRPRPTPGTRKEASEMESYTKVPQPVPPSRKFGRNLLIGLVLLLVAWRIVNPLVTVGAGQRAVIFSLQGGTL